MAFRDAVVVITLAGLAGAANAADSDFPYGPPPSGSSLYATSALAGDATVIFGGVSDDFDNFTYGVVAARVNIPMQNSWNFEPDIYYSRDSDSFTDFGGVAHFYKRLPDRSVGFYVGTRGFDGSLEVLAVGVEAETYAHPNSIIGGRVHYASTDWSFDWIQGEAWWDYFYTPNRKVTGKLEAWVQTDDILGGEASVVLTQRFEGTQVSGFLGGLAGASDGFSWLEASAGLTWNFDAPGTTQYEHDLMVPFSENEL